MIGMSDHSEANRRWENQVGEFRQSNSYRDLLGFDREPIEFEWNIFPDLFLGDPPEVPERPAKSKH